MPSDMSSIYNTLSPERREIRLLRFNGPLGTGSRTLHCSLEVVSLSAISLPVYVALSYMWGPESNASQLFKVYVQDTLFPVTDNLMIALIYLSMRCAQHIPLWIDAICINQAEPIERGHQVALMRDIYAKAFHVWAWQIPIKDCDLGMDFINEASNHVLGQRSQNNTCWPDLSRPWLNAKIKDPQMHDTWKSLVTLFQQPYWRRNWIIQELYINKNVTIVCGEKVARLGLLFAIVAAVGELSLLEGASQSSEPVRDFFAQSWYVSRIALLIGDESDTLSGLINRFTSSEATDPRDKVYSLVGIATRYSADKLPVDYTVQWPEVFRRAMKYIIEDDGNLNILSSSASGSSELPSWVANFAEQSRHDVGEGHHDATPGMVTTLTARYEAGGRLQLARFNANLTRLTVRVILVHTLSFILPRCHFGAELSPVEELTRRLGFLIADYATSTNRRTDVPQSFGVEIAAYISLRFYIATFHTIYLPSMVERIWPISDFVRFAFKCMPGNGLASDCTPAQLELLGTALNPYRSLFFCELPTPAFSLESDFRSTRANPSDLDAGVLESLRHCKFQVPGYCRNQHDWGQNGDIVSIVLGCHVPLLLRPVSAVGERPLVMKVVSEAYVYGIMNGEALGKGLPVCEITLV